MNRKSFLESARSGAAVALGIAGVFGGSFLVTTLVAQAQEQTPAATTAPSAPESVTATPPPAAPTPKAETAPRRPDREGPPRPAFKDFDTNGDGTISQAEFEAFRPTPPPRPPRFEDDRYRDAPEARDWRDDRGGRPPRGRDQYSMNDDRRGPPPPPDDRYREPRGDDRWGPPPPPDDRYAPRARGGRGPEGYGDRGGGCDHGDRDGGPRDHRGPRPEHGGPRPDDGRGYGPDDRTPPPPPPAPEN